MDHGIRYVADYGDDNFDGMSWCSPCVTPQVAYDKLPPDGGTVMFAGKGRFDLGDGLVLVRKKPAVFTSPGRGNRRAIMPGSSPNPGGPVLFSSTCQEAMVTFQPTSTLGYGFAFEKLHWEVPLTTSVVIDADKMGFLRVQDCSAAEPIGSFDQHPGFILLKARANGDASWMRVSDNFVRRGSLVHAYGPNINQWVIRENVVIPKDIPLPMIYMERAHRCVIRDNNLEGPGVGIYLSNCFGCRLDGNGGEESDPFVLLEDCWGILGTDCGVSNGPDKTFVRLTGKSADNFIIAAVGTGFANLYNNELFIDNQAPINVNFGKNWYLCPSTHRKPERLELSSEIKSTG